MRETPVAQRPPRVTTLLLGALALVVLVGLVALVSPTVRGQVALSLTRQDAPYVETYFTQLEQAKGCNPGRGRYVADVAVRSHLDEPARVPWVLTLTPARGGEPTVVEGDVATVPGREAVVRVAGRKPSRAYVATVTFPGRDQRLVVGCERRAR